MLELNLPLLYNLNLIIDDEFLLLYIASLSFAKMH